jgi:hypothetical protein
MLMSIASVLSQVRRWDRLYTRRDEMNIRIKILPISYKLAIRLPTLWLKPQPFGAGMYSIITQFDTAGFTAKFKRAFIFLKKEKLLRNLTMLYDHICTKFRQGIHDQQTVLFSKFIMDIINDFSFPISISRMSASFGKHIIQYSFMLSKLRQRYSRRGSHELMFKFANAMHLQSRRPFSKCVTALGLGGSAALLNTNASSYNQLLNRSFHNLSLTDHEQS